MIKPYFIPVNCVLIIIAAYLGVSAAYQLAGAKLEVPGPVPAATEQIGAPEPKTVQQPLTYYKAINERNLLNVKSGDEKPEAEVDVESLEQTELNLKLWGTVTGDEKEAYAVIEDTKARSQNLYRKGDTVQGAEIKLILRERVVLNVDGEDEVLEMEKHEGSPSRMKTASRPSGPHGLSSRHTQTINLKRDQIDDALKNVNQLMQQVRIMPHFENGRPDGFSLTGIRPNSIVRKMGLRNGDVITGVNGKQIETMDDAMGFYQQLSSGETVSVDMKRRGRERTIEYKIR